MFLDSGKCFVLTSHRILGSKLPPNKMPHMLTELLAQQRSNPIHAESFSSTAPKWSKWKKGSSGRDSTDTRDFTSSQIKNQESKNQYLRIEKIYKICNISS